MTRSDVDRRANHNRPRQCISDHGMHKDAPVRRPKKPKPQTALGAELTKWLAANT
jgi:hypothetical protein